jgi:sugar/nucleoside kinase (ribokinase family)
MSLAIVGNLNLDLKTSPLPAGPALLADGETSAGEIYETLGGGGANTALAAARLGLGVTLVAAVGDDALGRRLAAFLSACGVTPRLALKPAATGRSLALSYDNHQRHFVSHLPSAALLTAGDIDLPTLVAAGCRQLYRADPWFAPAMTAEGNRELLAAARAAGLTTALDLNYDPLWRAGRADPEVRRRLAAMAEVLPQVDELHGNARELGFFSGRSDWPAAAAWCLERGAGAVVMHLGAAGSAAVTASGVVRVAAEPVASVVGETGSGDVFTAAVLAGAGRDWPARLAAGNAAAARHLAGLTEFAPRLAD